MKIYIVTETRGMTYEGDTYVRGAWSNAEAAEVQAAKLQENWPDHVGVLEVELDSEIDDGS